MAERGVVRAVREAGVTMSAEGNTASGREFWRHRALLAVAAGGAVAEAGLLAIGAPGALPIASQVTALPPVAAYHDLRWLFADAQPWPAFTVVLAVALLARSALDMALLRLAWPFSMTDDDGSPLSRPPASRAYWSALSLTAVCWVLLAPAATLVFGAAVLPFSWPLIGALPIMAGVLLVLSHGGTLEGWWHRLPPWRALAWLLVSLVLASAASAVITRLNTAGGLLITAVAGLANARAWYGMAVLAARLPDRSASWLPARVLHAIPLAPLAALLTLALVVGTARLMFTGTIKVGSPAASAAALAAGAAGSGGTAGGSAGPADNSKKPAVGHLRPGAVLVVEGWGTSCCDAAGGLSDLLRTSEPGTVVRQFSYRGLDASGHPLHSRPADDDLPLPRLGDKIAAQVQYLHRATGGPVSVVAESEGTLGVYAMLARHPRLPVQSVAMLSPIIDPGQVHDPRGAQRAGAVPSAALSELDHLVGSISPYGSAGAQNLLFSVSEYGAQYFTSVDSSGGTARVHGKQGTLRWLGVVPLADALTMPACDLPSTVLVVPAFHGGLLGDPAVLPAVARFLGGQQPVTTGRAQTRLRNVAEVIARAATAWRMPDLSGACASP